MSALFIWGFWVPWRRSSSWLFVPLWFASSFPWNSLPQHLTSPGLVYCTNYAFFSIFYNIYTLLNIEARALIRSLSCLQTYRASLKIYRLKSSSLTMEAIEIPINFSNGISIFPLPTICYYQSGQIFVHVPSLFSLLIAWFGQAQVKLSSHISGFALSCPGRYKAATDAS